MITQNANSESQNTKSTKDISVVIIAKNEEKRIGDCLKSVSWAHEIVVIDSGSTDKTKEIATKCGATVYGYVKGGYSDWRNYGLKKAKGLWILYIDADERVTPELRGEIIKQISGLKSQIFDNSAFAIPRKNIVLGKQLKHGGWWPDYVKRLFKKNRLSGWTGEVHEEPEFKGEMGYLENALIHIKEDNLSDMVEKTNIRSDIEARLLYNSGHPKMNIVRFFSAMAREAWLRIIKYKGFLDGSQGIIFSIYQVWSKFVTYAKLWEMQRGDSN